MYLKVQGLVLRVTAYNDHDALLTLLTPEQGKLTVKARGLRRKNSPLIAPCQLLAYGEFTLFEHRGYYTIQEAVSINLFQNVRQDIVKLALGSYFSQVAEVISQEDTPSPELLQLVLNCLYVLSNKSLPCGQIKSVFELRIACISGYTPDLSPCECGNLFPDRFHTSMGKLECQECGQWGSEGIRMPVTPGVVNAMRYIVDCHPKEIFSFTAGEDTLEILSSVTEVYLTTQLERSFSTLNFYKSLF